MPSLDVNVPSTPSFQVDAVSSSEAASLKGHKAKTPIIAGSVCGGLLGAAWIVGFIVYFIKKRKRKERNAKEAAGLVPPKKKSSTKPAEKIIIPPDPAVILGHRRPGEHAFLDDQGSQGHDSSLFTTPPMPMTKEQIADSSRAIASQQSSHSASTPVTTVHETSHIAPTHRHNTANGAKKT